MVRRDRRRGSGEQGRRDGPAARLVGWLAVAAGRRTTMLRPVHRAQGEVHASRSAEGSRTPPRNRRHQHRQPGSERGSRAHRRDRGLPQRPALRRRSVADADADRARARVGRRRREGRRAGAPRRARRSRDHLPVGVLRPLRALPRRAPRALWRSRDRPSRRRAAAALRGRGARAPVRSPVVVRRAAARARERGRQGARGDAAGEGGAHRMWRDDRRRGGVSHGAGRAGLDGRGDRLRRRRAVGRQRRRARRRGAGHRGRRGRLEARAGAAVRGHRRGRCERGSIPSRRCAS